MRQMHAETACRNEPILRDETSILILICLLHVVMMFWSETFCDVSGRLVTFQVSNRRSVRLSDVSNSHSKKISHEMIIKKLYQQFHVCKNALILRLYKNLNIVTFFHHLRHFATFTGLLIYTRQHGFFLFKVCTGEIINLYFLLQCSKLQDSKLLILCPLKRVSTKVT